MGRPTRTPQLIWTTQQEEQGLPSTPNSSHDTATSPPPFIRCMRSEARISLGSDAPRDARAPLDVCITECAPNLDPSRVRLPPETDCFLSRRWVRPLSAGGMYELVCALQKPQEWA